MEEKHAERRNGRTESEGKWNQVRDLEVECEEGSREEREEEEAEETRRQEGRGRMRKLNK